MHAVKEAVRLILSDLNYLSQEDLNADEDVINFQNGLLRVSGSSMTLLPHSPSVLSSIQIPCNWTDKEGTAYYKTEPFKSQYEKIVAVNKTAMEGV